MLSWQNHFKQNYHSVATMSLLQSDNERNDFATKLNCPIEIIAMPIIKWIQRYIYICCISQWKHPFHSNQFPIKCSTDWNIWHNSDKLCSLHCSACEMFESIFTLHRHCIQWMRFFLPVIFFFYHFHDILLFIHDFSSSLTEIIDKFWHFEMIINVLTLR